MAGQQKGDKEPQVLQQVLGWLQAKQLSLKSLDISACGLEGLRHVLARLPDMCSLCNIAVAENMLTTAEATPLLQAIQNACDKESDAGSVDVDLAYNAVQHPSAFKEKCR
eukprot:6124198-Amphidinium_carterae.1